MKNPGEYQGLSGTFADACRKAERNREHGVSLADFYAYMPQHSYIFAPTGDLWPSGSVNARVPPIALVDENNQPILDPASKQKLLPASAWLDRYRPVEQMTWAPAEPMLIHDCLISEGGWIERDGVTCFNLYRPPVIDPGNAAKAHPWIDHVHRIYPNEADRIIRWLAHRVQFPEEKINHALVLGALQGIGTCLSPSSMRWDRGISQRYHRSTCSGASMGSLSR
jgi:hypothetical protein